MVEKLDLYKVFNEVAIQKSITKAAKKLYVSQPAISQAISQLEDELGVTLFIRNSKGVNLTTEGRILFKHVNAGINQILMGEIKILESKKMDFGSLIIGVGDTILRYMLIDTLLEYKHKYPKIQLRIINRTSDELVKLVESGEIELAICNLPIDNSNLKTKKIREIQDILVTSPKHFKNIDDNISLRDVLEYPLIMLDKRSNTRKYVENYLFSKEIIIRPQIELGSHDLVLEFVKNGFGFAFVVKEFSDEYIVRKEIIQVKTEIDIPKRSIGICYIDEKTLSHAAYEFLNILQI
ncbi:MAG: LysR family transcriptional regulator [Tissierellales bacterium]|nr:LysR family transcriptional regulator [Tissierellales bacterium]